MSHLCADISDLEPALCFYFGNNATTCIFIRLNQWWQIISWYLICSVEFGCQISNLILCQNKLYKQEELHIRGLRTQCMLKSFSNKQSVWLSAFTMLHKLYYIQDAWQLGWFVSNQAQTKKEICYMIWIIFCKIIVLSTNYLWSSNPVGWELSIEGVNVYIFIFKKYRKRDRNIDNKVVDQIIPCPVSIHLPYWNEFFLV